MKNVLFLLVGLAIAMFVTSCSEECKKCDEALVHMCNKIQAQGCNPASMMEAQDRIREECDDLNEGALIYYMAETCNLGTVQCAECDIAPVISNLELNVSKFYSTGGWYELLISYGDVQQQFGLDSSATANTFESIVLSSSVFEGQNFTIELYRNGIFQDEIIAPFTFNRPNDYTALRNIGIDEVSTGNFELYLTQW